ncbi:MAG: peroxidase-related enzyme [Bacteroidetes bacterium]|nr:peroxidase-related enzyme [Bacteroidota bacterium]MCH7769430.1 peroxidase-related enzyme [Bacteroidota bacterium]MCH9029618.1 peroxidase-related enzyme [Bacteroidota bacterium]
MPYIKVVEQNQAAGELKEIYSKVVGKRGKLSNILKIHSLLPKTMIAHLDFYMSIMFNKSGIRRADAELIATVVSALNNCAYCVNHHSEALKSYWKDKEKVKQASEDFRKLDLPEKTKAILEYAEKLTLHPDRMNESDVVILRNNGLTDEEILSVVLIINYFNFVNRVANGLGIDFSEEEIKGYKY